MRQIRKETMELNAIHNEDCLVTMKEHIDEKSVDIVLTSPPYCTSNRAGKKSTANLTTMNTKYYPSYRYDVFLDNMTQDEYIEWTVKLFEGFDRILKKDGCVLYNVSYSSDNRETMFLVVADILRRTNFSLADWIGWKKRTALPNNTSPNKLTRIFEPVFVFARKGEIDTFACNKKVVSVRERTGQKMYENVYNFIDAANNDGSCSLNKATYSSELCEKLLNLYGKSGMTVYDPFMGTGTTGVACKRFGMNYVGSEISTKQVEFANDRIAKDDGIRRIDGDGVAIKMKGSPKGVVREETTASETDNLFSVAQEPSGCEKDCGVAGDSAAASVLETNNGESVHNVENGTTPTVVVTDDSFETMFTSSVGFSAASVSMSSDALSSSNESEWETI